VKPATACRKANYSRDTIYIRNDSEDMSTAAGPPESVGNSATIEKKATCKWTPVPIPDAREARNSMEVEIPEKLIKQAKKFF
jgi:hypothetical protein